ncbi:MAG: glycosyltransferase family 4 protein [Sphingobacteriales bacterium]|nr:glycosyltransferase family 4 protein [Sphingobacteriales bacterium]
MNKEKELIILVPGFPENEQDSTCLPWLQNTVRKLHEINQALKITVLSFQYPHRYGVYYWKGIKVMAFGGANKQGLSKLFLRFRVNKQLSKIYKRKRITGILSIWYGECARAGQLFAQKKNLKHLCWIAGQDAKKENKFPGRLNIKGNNLVAVSDFLQEYFEQNHAVRPQHVIPFGTDASAFGNERPGKDIDLLAVGSLIPLKQYEIFVEVIKRIKTDLPLVKAVLIGSGPERDKITELINEDGLQNNIRLTGALPYNETLQYMKRAKVFLHPSSYEGFGCVCAEALYAGAYVIRFTNPMNKAMTNTVIAGTKEEMIQKAIERLNQNSPYESINEYPVEETAGKISLLFGL